VAGVSALEVERDSLPAPRPRALRFDRRGWEGAPVAPWAGTPTGDRERYSPDARSVPVPPLLRRYVRGPGHFADVLGALAGKVGGEGKRGHYVAADLKAGQEVLRLFADERPREDGGPVGLHDRDAARLLLTLFPPVPCPSCGRLFLKETRRREYCGDHCRRAAAYAAERARREVPA
jgi:hypothetical protein